MNNNVFFSDMRVSMSRSFLLANCLLAEVSPALLSVGVRKFSKVPSSDQ
jgi:hypothetical protein